MTTRTRNFRKEEEAVSPVIGVILMVAITVILAAVIGAFVFGMGGSLKKTYTVGATATQQGATTVDVTFQGGPDADLVAALNVSIDGVYYDSDGNGTTVEASTFGSNPSVGKMVSCTNIAAVANPATGSISTGRDHVVVAARFDDGTVQVILDTYV